MQFFTGEYKWVKYGKAKREHRSLMSVFPAFEIKVKHTITDHTTRNKFFVSKVMNVNVDCKVI